MDLLGLPVALSVSSELDEDACRTVRYSWPDTVEAGDVKNLNEDTILGYRLKVPHARWLLLVVGFPCQDLSGLNAKRKGLEGQRSGLSHEIP